MRNYSLSLFAFVISYLICRSHCLLTIEQRPFPAPTILPWRTWMYYLLPCITSRLLYQSCLSSVRSVLTASAVYWATIYQPLALSDILSFCYVSRLHLFLSFNHFDYIFYLDFSVLLSFYLVVLSTALPLIFVWI